MRISDWSSDVCSSDLLAAAFADDDDILQQVERVEQRHAQRADMDPCSRQKLEILGYPPVEGESQFRSGGVDEACGVARAIKAFLVECRGGRLGVAQDRKSVV